MNFEEMLNSFCLLTLQDHSFVSSSQDHPGTDQLIHRSSSFFATTHFNAVPSKLLSIAVQACLSSFKLSCSKCNLMTSTQVSMHPSELSLNSFGFLKVFLTFFSNLFTKPPCIYLPFNILMQVETQLVRRIL